ncbi:hypothetical protein [Sediminibacterium soli]|uniref:hypothetical protein n=1 Tax=Sediminibacterium soli TaxID=2698829 RepID=UPI00137AED6A|nr:hypothetical protein [Sediminibacterium soli]NCI46760.1 hypothetical protein [Sediminibacterium soli]
MGLITAYRHGSFVRCADASIRQLEALPPAQTAPDRFLTELKNDIALLEYFYSQFDLINNQLRQLVDQYQHLQKNTRIKLREGQIKYLRK